MAATPVAISASAVRFQARNVRSLAYEKRASISRSGGSAGSGPIGISVIGRAR